MDYQPSLHFKQYDNIVSHDNYIKSFNEMTRIKVLRTIKILNF